MNANILMVEDDQALLEFYSAALSPAYTVLSATNVPAARRLLEERTVDAVVCDLHLGSESGLDLLAWIQARKPHLMSHILVVSGDLSADMGGFDVLVLLKPLSLQQLLRAVEVLLAPESDVQAGEGA